MPTRREIASAIDEAESVFERCWETLSLLKRSELNSATTKRLFSFQYELAVALLALSDAYRSVSSAIRGTVARKGQLQKGSLEGRLRLFGKYQNALKETIDVGLTLGDSFAWMFYLQDQPLLRKHLAVRLDPHIPPGIGGKAEVLFLKNLPKIGHHFILYHGITTFLRLGDVTLFNLRKGRVESIGELKARLIPGNRLETTLHAVGRSKSKVAAVSRRNRARPNLEMQPRQAALLGRQLARMSRVFDQSPRLRNRADQVESPALSALRAAIPSSTRFHYSSAGRSLVFAAARMRVRSLSSAFLPGRARRRYPVEGVEIEARKLLLPESSHNSLLIGHLEGRAFLEMTPMFWWPVDMKLLHDLIFRRAAVFTIYNPAHLIESLKALGLEVVGEGRDMRFQKRVGEATIVIGGFETFARFVQSHLLPEQAVVAIARRMIRSAERKVQRGSSRESIRIELTIAQHFGVPPDRPRGA